VAEAVLLMAIQILLLAVQVGVALEELLLL
jgi:hypothetical protein